MLTNTCPWTSTKPSKRVWMIFIALALPSFRSKLKRVFVVLFVVMIRYRLNIDTSSFKNRNVGNIVIFLCNPSKHTSPGPIISRGLILNPIDIGELLEIFFSDIFITFYHFINLLSELFFNLTI